MFYLSGKLQYEVVVSGVCETDLVDGSFMSEYVNVNL